MYALAFGSLASFLSACSSTNPETAFEYTDDTFTTRTPRAPEWEHLGFLGPLIRAQAGDTIRIVFRNNSRFPASLHPHGVSYKKDSEGAHTTTARAAPTRPMTACPPAALTSTRGPSP
ncbi:MAG TPA: multicopper oxidase domain-containing protein, partial [Vicinamibacterales bacterium]